MAQEAVHVSPAQQGIWQERADETLPSGTAPPASASASTAANIVRAGENFAEPTVRERNNT